MAEYTISDFVSNLWGLAKRELSANDPEFVSKLDSEVRLNKIGLVVEKPSTLRSKPKTGLSRKWHKLLEACMELELRVDCLKTSAQFLSPAPYENATTVQAGKEGIYHDRSWFIHAVAVGEQVKTIVLKAIDLFPATTEEKKAIRESLKTALQETIMQHITDQRHDYIHGERSSWPSGITEDELWEGAVSVGLTPDRVLNEFVYPDEGEKVKSGKRRHFESVTEEMLSRAGGILKALNNWIVDRKSEKSGS